MTDWSSFDIGVRTEESSQRVARACITVQLYGGAAFARQAHVLYRNWLDRVPADAPLHYVNRSALSPRPLAPKDRQRIDAALVRCSAKNEYYWINSAPGYELGAHTLEIDLWPDNDAVSSAVVMCRALDSAVTPALAAELLQEFTALLQTDGLVHASAGLGMGVIWGDDFEQACGPRLFATCMRHLGLDLPNRAVYAYLREHIKGPGWLTFLSQPLAPRLATATGAPAGYREVDLEHGGRLLIAGNLPPLGDVNRRAPDIAGLRHAAKVLRPLRMTRWVDIPLPLDSFDVETDVWLSRLDGTAP
ncbi:type VI immunity family protein [Pseudorhodoferax soli]|uniref:Uncharacterized protein DUF3396 n=1 Tax=Pseudorhodoferax soli TaxID=545864 RepID=A0A368YA92_9BURK|nr:type VI immunity family protein [Pseudorhodoferax soli]RCW75747.1 uncharacterized protein DUF3396 [Pseudorhodoferax soli]